MKTVRGTRLLVGKEAADMMLATNKCVCAAIEAGYQPVMLPSLDFADFYKQKLDPDLRMYEFDDRKGRKLCLRPECTNTLAAMDWEPDTKLFYVERCWRYDKPQKGRYREFTQFGVEWLNPTAPMRVVMNELQRLAYQICNSIIRTEDLRMNLNVSRGSGYYKGGLGFELECDLLGAQKQVVGGGEYDGGAGFAIGADRLAMIIGGDV